MTSLFPEAPEPRPKDCYIVFRGCKAGKLSERGDYVVTRTMIKDWQRKYPDVNVEREVDALHDWWETEPTRRKTLAGMPRFFRNNLSKHQRRADRQRTRWQKTNRHAATSPTDIVALLHRRLEYYTKMGNTVMVREIQKKIDEAKRD